MSLETRQPNLEGPDMQIERQEDSPRFEYERLERFASSSSKVEDIFLENPEVSFSELNELIEKMVSEQSLSDDQKEKLVARAYSYVESHQSINKMVDDYQEKGEYWQNELFKDMFGVYPKGKVKLEIEPMFLYWKTTNIDDYTYCQNKATSYLTGTAIEQRESLKGSKRLLRKIIPQAFAIPSNVLPGLKARVGVRSPRSPIFGSLDHLLQLHERRHGIDRGLESPESLKELQSLMNPSLVDNDKRVKEIIPEAVKLGLELSLTSARSEILALFEPLDNYFQKGKGKYLVDKLLRLYLKGKTVELADSDSKQFRRQLPTQIFQEEMKGISGQKETGGILPKNQHNYPERIKNIIGELLVNRTGKDYSSLVRGEVEKQKPAFERQLFQSLVAAEVLGTNTKLKPKEFMWLLENEPIERWAELVRMAGEDMNAEFVQELEKRGFTSENISK